MSEPHRHTTALIFITDTSGSAIEQAAQCAAYCRRRHYDLDSVVLGTEHWDEVADLALRRVVDVVVVPSRGLLPPDRAARLESVTDELPRTAGRPVRRKRRTRRLR